MLKKLYREDPEERAFWNFFGGVLILLFLAGLSMLPRVLW